MRTYRRLMHFFLLISYFSGIPSVMFAEPPDHDDGYSRERIAAAGLNEVMKKLKGDPYGMCLIPRVIATEPAEVKSGVGKTKVRRITQLSLSCTDCGDNDVCYLQPLSRLTALNLFGTSVTDVGIHDVAKLEKLELLLLSYTALTDEGLLYVCSMKNLKTLMVGHTQITNLGLKHVADLEHLEVLDISNTRVTAQGLRQLIGLKNLRELDLDEGQFDSHEIDALHRASPKLRFRKM